MLKINSFNKEAKYAQSDASIWLTTFMLKMAQ